MKRILTMSVREIYAALLIILMLLFSLIYTSMALFEKTVEKVGVASIIASEINFTITSDETSFISNGNYGTITVPASETKTFNITITNNKSNSVRYKMYYRFENDITILDVSVGIMNTSESSSTDLIGMGVSKTVSVKITNNSTQSATIEIGAQGGYSTNNVVLDIGRNEMEKVQEKTIPTFKDTSGANEPVLADGMIPVVYDNNNDVWLVADTDAGYYAYQDQIWANAVTVTSENRSTYLNAESGTPIPMNDINSMWVWIPRYRYKIPSNIGGSSNVTNPPQIDVIFETGTETNGVTEAVYRNGIANDGTNTNYYTHPSFRNVDNIEYDSSTISRGAWDEEITGFWVGKFETGNTDDNPLIKPDIVSLTMQNVSTQFLTSLTFAGGTMDATTGAVTFTTNENNAYGLNTTTNTTDTHMMKNTEWGAVAILSQSQYGKMGNSNYTGTNKIIYINNSDSMYTGRSGGNSTESSNDYGNYSYNDMTCGTTSAECIGEKVAHMGTGASTTGTIYGVYDMNGGVGEYVMGNYNYYSGPDPDTHSAFNGVTTFGDITNGISFPDNKYYDLYLKPTKNTLKEQTILGDAVWETLNWISPDINFVFIYEGAPWFIRGGFYDDSTAVFAAFGTDGAARTFRGWRATMMP